MNYTPCNGCIAVLFQLYHYQLASDLFPGIGFPVHCARKGMQNRGKFTLYIKLPCILCSYSSSWMVGHLLELGLPYYLITSTPLCVKKKKRCYRLCRFFPLFSLEWHFAVGLHIRSVSGNLSNYTLNYSSIQYFWCILQKHLYFLYQISILCLS